MSARSPRARRASTIDRAITMCPPSAIGGLDVTTAIRMGGTLCRGSGLGVRRSVFGCRRSAFGVRRSEVSTGEPDDITAGQESAL